MKKIVIFIIIFYSMQANANWIISGTIEDITNQEKVNVIFYGYHNGHERIISEIKETNNCFTQIINKNLGEGIYKILLYNDNFSKAFNIILVKEEHDISFSCNLSKPNLLPIFKNSKQNEKLTNYSYYRNDNIQKIAELKGYLLKYGNTNENNISVTDINRVLNSLKKEYTAYTNTILNANDNKWLKLIIKFEQDLNFSTSIINEDNIIENDLIEAINSNTEIILRTPLLSEYLQSRIMKVFQKKSNPSEIKKTLKNKYSILISIFKNNSKIKDFLINHAREVSELIDYEENQEFISESEN